jgi:hypothetical protein
LRISIESGFLWGAREKPAGEIANLVELSVPGWNAYLPRKDSKT